MGISSPVMYAAAADADRSARATNRYSLKMDDYWLLNLPQGRQFDASALLLREDQSLLTVNDRDPTLFRVRLSKEVHEADLVPVAGAFTPEQLKAFAREKLGRYDSEGLARDERNRIYVCEEANRWVLRWDPASNTVERLVIDWSPVEQYFNRSDGNASFEGIAIGGGKIYVANERSRGRIIVVNLESLKVEGDFAPHPADMHAVEVFYSDLSWFDGHLYVLLRESRCVLQVEPHFRKVVAEFNFRALDTDPEFRYRARLPFGNMEGLAVDADYFWLVTDNNGEGRVRYPEDKRPTLFRCRRPDR